MTRKEIDGMLAAATAHRDNALQILREHFDELEARNQETFWVRLYLLKKSEVEWLQKQKAEDE